MKLAVLAKMPMLALLPLGRHGRDTLRASKAIVAAAAAVGSILLAAGCTSSGSPNAARPFGSNARSAAAFHGMAGLVAAAQREGQLNVIGLPSTWANYGTIMDDFTALYGIKITDMNPEGSSQDELNAVKQLKGQSNAPDVVDIDSASAAEGEHDGYWAPYRVTAWNKIPTWAKLANGGYYAAYGGYMAIGYEPSLVKVAPTTFKSLLRGPYRNQVAIDGDPTQTRSAFAAVYAAALANGGSLANIAAGVNYFRGLKHAGNFVQVRGTPGTMLSGQTPILIWWDYLLNSQVRPLVKNLKIVIPPDGVYASYYNQAISASAPHPAAARLWEEFLYSAEGQNLFLEGSVRPIELRSLLAAGMIDAPAYQILPKVPASAVYQLPSAAEQATADTVVAKLWPSVTG
ncbi:extracellular solute-binding protein [Trebonia kvetii]|uniref:Extracellular solute-binding protein n=1 Tax=Trebonia kvetii TaxID=2480626 RepID=A0A6P2C1E3_9ACTN|nr:extracellular solute-binding protein [Trebonia kvetii]